MKAENRHPSYLELDRIAAGAGTESSTSHVAQCETCAAYLEKLSSPVAVPDWARALESETKADLLSHVARWRRASAWAAAGVACAALVGVLLVGPLDPGRVGEAPGQTPVDNLFSVRSKGMPTAAVYILRQGDVLLWDGQFPVQPGDRIRLKVIPEQHRHLAVVSGEGENSADILFQGPVSSGDEGFLLPQSWEVDDAPGAETLTIIFSSNPLPERQLRALAGASAHQNDIWTTHVVLYKRSQG